MGNALPYTKMKFKTVSICGRLYKCYLKVSVYNMYSHSDVCVYTFLHVCRYFIWECGGQRSILGFNIIVHLIWFWRKSH